MSKKTKSAMLALALAGLSAMPVSYAADPVKQNKPASEKKAHALCALWQDFV